MSTYPPIVEVLPGSDQGLSLENHHWARQPTFLGNWNIIRIGWRWHHPIDQVVSSMASNDPNFQIGMCAGQVNIPLAVPDANVDHALMWRTQQNSTWNYNDNGITHIANGSSTNHFNKIESGTRILTSSANSFSKYIGAINSSMDAVRVGVVLQIEKGSPYTLTVYGRSATTEGIGYDTSFLQISDAMLATNPAVFLGGSVFSNTLDIDESTHGTLDTVFAAWAHSSPPIYVSEILVARLA